METVHEAVIRTARLADAATLAACLALLLVLAVSQLSAVFLRYFMGQGFIWLGDVTAWSFAALAMLSMPLALARDANIRVDVLVEKSGEKARKQIDLLAIVLLLFPIFLLLAASALPQVLTSWRILEASPQIGGLPGYFLVRTIPVIVAGLMLLQGLARLAELSRPT
jgi:TRAP-type mannitol/chloroaromatic compound transport system permease small subunit